MGTPHKPRGPKPQKFTCDNVCMTKDNQLAKASVTVTYLSSLSQRDWFNMRAKQAMSALVDNYVADINLYDVTTDRNPAPQLIKQLTEIAKTATKTDPKPAPTIKIESVSLIIKRER